ncbi:MAG TPA: branched-chain amino acid ABC transporter substrate-binding protein [Rhodobacteraceae bacterium]|nr:ABC transporter substrate-binding protein [Amylibacter sp.]MDG1998518.1 ABC transporter substrate-binding protein [Amylibacter sp.]HAD27475.1 branched-chain amino acid ABC transporter substrate-binding protein [Paracoccaceae bacterium]|tara:strand:+ start:339 stop:1601 length:1263 start_codon:yes stop_codon:yes gene_type:complete
MTNLSRRVFLKTTTAAFVAASLATPALAADPIILGIPAAQSGPVGVADHQDWTNGAMMAIEEINAAGGVKGRPIEAKIIDLDMLSPEGNVAGIQALIEGGAHAIASAFTIIPQPAMDTAAPSGIPYVHGNTSSVNVDLFKSDKEKYRNIFQLDVPEVWYGTGFVRFMSSLRDSGQWKPKNNKVHIVQGQISYTQMISQATQKEIAASNGGWEVAAVTDIQFPVQDWAPVIRALQDTDAGAIMIDHWIAAELAAFAQQYAYDPVPGALVYLQYGPSQPEFLDLAAGAGEGMVWGTVYGVYADKIGSAFREKYRAKYPGTMGMVYTGGGYDAVKILAQAWESVEDPSKFDDVGNYIRGMNYRGINGLYKIDPETNSGVSFPNMTNDPEGGQAHLFFQVQNNEHTIVAPKEFAQAPFKLAPWM